MNAPQIVVDDLLRALDLQVELATGSGDYAIVEVIGQVRARLDDAVTALDEIRAVKNIPLSGAWARISAILEDAPRRDSRPVPAPGYVLRDIDNRDGDGAPFELKGTLEQVIAYIDGPVRGDVVPGSDSVDDVLAELRAGRFDAAAEIARPSLGLYLSRAEAN